MDIYMCIVSGIIVKMEIFNENIVIKRKVGFCMYMENSYIFGIRTPVSHFCSIARAYVTAHQHFQ